jgi:hypothetical protein
MDTPQPTAGPWVEEAFRRLCDDFPHWHKAHRDFTLTLPDGSTVTVRGVAMEDLEHNVNHAAVLAETVGDDCTAYPDIVRQELKSSKRVTMVMTTPFEHHQDSNQTLVFSNTVYVYTTTVKDPDLLRRVFNEAGMKLVLRDNDYYEAKKEHERSDLFICHDSRDKEFVRPLARALQEQFVNVWYDEFSIAVGDSIIQRIDEGLQSCRLAVIVVSKNLISRKKWSFREFRSLSSRETESCKKVILPVWLGVTREEVAAYSPDLADKYALNASLGTEALAAALKREVIKGT